MRCDLKGLGIHIPLSAEGQRYHTAFFPFYRALTICKYNPNEATISLNAELLFPSILVSKVILMQLLRDIKIFYTYFSIASKISEF